DRGGIARRQPQQQEHDQRHHAHHGNGGQYAAKQISEHPCPNLTPAGDADLVSAVSVSGQQIPCHWTNFERMRGRIPRLRCHPRMSALALTREVRAHLGEPRRMATVRAAHPSRRAPDSVSALPGERAPQYDVRAVATAVHYSSVANSPAIRRPRSARLSTSICSLSVCASAPRTPSPSSVGMPIAPVKLPSEPPPALPWGSSTPSDFATPRAFS